MSPYDDQAANRRNGPVQVPTLASTLPATLAEAQARWGKHPEELVGPLLDLAARLDHYDALEDIGSLQIAKMAADAWEALEAAGYASEVTAARGTSIVQ